MNIALEDLPEVVELLAASNIRVRPALQCLLGLAERAYGREHLLRVLRDEAGGLTPPSTGA